MAKEQQERESLEIPLINANKTRYFKHWWLVMGDVTAVLPVISIFVLESPLQWVNFTSSGSDIVPSRCIKECSGS